MKWTVLSILLALICSLSSPLCSANIISRLAKKGELRWKFTTYTPTPLLVSPWHRQHPGVLPYEKCVIETHGNERRHWFGVFAGTESGSDHDVHWMTCFSPTLNIAFTLPVRLEKFTSFGMFLELPWLFKDSEEIFISGLHGKTLSEIYGKFGGVSFRIGVGGGLSLMRLTNEYGVSLTRKRFSYTSIGLNFVGTKGKLSPSRTLSKFLYFNEQSRNPFDLINRQFALFPLERWLSSHHTFVVDYTELSTWRFEHVGKDPIPPPLGASKPLPPPNREEDWKLKRFDMGLEMENIEEMMGRNPAADHLSSIAERRRRICRSRAL